MRKKRVFTSSKRNVCCVRGLLLVVNDASFLKLFPSSLHWISPVVRACIGVTVIDPPRRGSGSSIGIHAVPSAPRSTSPVERGKPPTSLSPFHGWVVLAVIFGCRSDSFACSPGSDGNA